MRFDAERFWAADNHPLEKLILLGAAVALLVGLVWGAPPHDGYPCPCCVPHTYELPAGADAKSPCVEAIRVTAQVLVDEAREECLYAGGPHYGRWSDAVGVCNDLYAVGTQRWAWCHAEALFGLGQVIGPINNAYEGEWISIRLWADYEISLCP